MSLHKTTVKQGNIEGLDRGRYALYLGVPYGKIPQGKSRFAQSQIVDSWEKTCVAKKRAPIAWQGVPEKGSFYEKEFYSDDSSFSNCSEDCLYLNIWTPAKSTDDRLPVLFWIHGGAFGHGHSMEKEFDGEEYCKRGIILVTIQYRLGIFGFPAHPWMLTGEENPGIGDQLTALKWVYENIHNFGGDTRKITVAGQSAGGVSVQALMTIPEARPMIHQVILQSGGGYGQLKSRSHNREAQKDYGYQLMEKMGISSREELERLPADRLLHLAQDNSFKPWLVIEQGEESLYEKWDKSITCLLGSNENDIRVTEEMLKKGIPSDLYIGNREFARHFKHNGTCFLYYFKHKLPGDTAGSFHSSELWYMFGTLKRSWRPFNEQDYLLSEEMLEAWSSFIQKGYPMDEKEWKAYDEESGEIYQWG